MTTQPTAPAEITHVLISGLRVPNRPVDECKVKAMMVEIITEGFTEPITITRNNWISDGKVRYLAAKRLGIATVPCVRIIKKCECCGHIL